MAVPGPDADWIGFRSRMLACSQLAESVGRAPLGIGSAISTGASGTPPTWYFRLLARRGVRAGLGVASWTSPFLCHSLHQ